ncbi:hypothetical protein ACQKN7_27390 [Bacillus cereus]|uniref:hypothetical protein n=1 Tax=Bacillus cereus TaxID=1396 RepID=UPI003D01D1B0
MVNIFWNRIIWFCGKCRNVYLFTGLLLVGCLVGSMGLVDFSMMPDNVDDVLSLTLHEPQTEYHMKGRLLSCVAALIFLILGFSQILLSLEKLLQVNIWKALLPLVFGFLILIVGRAFFALSFSFFSGRLIIIAILLLAVIYFIRKKK